MTSFSSFCMFLTLFFFLFDVAKAQDPTPLLGNVFQLTDGVLHTSGTFTTDDSFGCFLLNNTNEGGTLVSITVSLVQGLSRCIPLFVADQPRDPASPPVTQSSEFHRSTSCSQKSGFESSILQYATYGARPSAVCSNAWAPSYPNQFFVRLDVEPSRTVKFANF